MRCMADVDANLDAHSYPATASELIEAYGETELELQNGSETFGEALGRLGETTYESADDAKTAAMSAVSEGAIGRKGYSDRDAPTVGGMGPSPVSF
ncbi:DUF2795 domain-containing protein [Halosegnis rubeus]|uniref:DUF2795 domain-containing protein n=1 Tax=Halosegnis rubeus TaxID=2212850 RepID=A0A5N5UG86_9EURY|nr:DUF2795 domain-containing protein [Halosegnis rubeus]KAB7515232.1 DUF2795 domain-containing protein [Halosegnis rubeus]KAB7516286.1 DUF2795 domain-containing protein [Halosegnis rubeus]KAB7517726.1 DUF2795 domain-containing protein [Halosegnis rubeus]